MSDGNIVMHYSVRVRNNKQCEVWGVGGVQDKQSGSANPENE